MKNILITLLFTTLLMAENNNVLLDTNSTLQDNNVTVVEIVADPNPKVYASLGDVIYDSVASVEKLQNIEKYSNKIQKIQTYVDDVSKVKEIGYAIEKGDSTINKGDYLVEIRALSKRNNEFKREVEGYYKSSMTYKDNSFFSEMVNSGLLDTTKYRSEIMSYYSKYNTEIDASGVIQGFLDEEAQIELEKQLKASKKVVITRKQIRDAKIRRVRKNVKHKEEQFNQGLEDELAQKKIEIIKEQEASLLK